MLQRLARAATVVAACFAGTAALSANAFAQRFEGIITMRLTGNPGAMARDARGAGPRVADGRGGAGARGADGRGRAGARVADGRGGAATREREARAGGGAEASASDGRPSDPRAEAMRNAVASGLQQVEYLTRRGRVRISLGGASNATSPAAMIYVPDNGMMYTLFPSVSMYAEMSISDISRGMDQSAQSVPARPEPRPPTVTHTKQFELVAGHRCEHVLIKFEKLTTDVCMAKGLGVFIMPAVMGRAEGWNSVMSEANGFPLRVKQPNGTVTMEVTKIERKALAEALFNVPDSYTKMPDITRRPPN